MEQLVVTTVTIGKNQLAYVKTQSDNVSRYIRSLIDREIGASRLYQHVNIQPVRKEEVEKKKEPEIQVSQKKTTVWSSFPVNR